MPQPYIPNEVREAFNTISRFKTEVSSSVRSASCPRSSDWTTPFGNNVQAKDRVRYRNSQIKAVNNALANMIATG